MPRAAAPHSPVIAVDPGRDKCGLAVVENHVTVFRAWVPTPEIGLTCHFLGLRHPGSRLVLGAGTTSQAVATALRAACPGLPLEKVAEAHSTLEAQKLYWAENPPRGWRRLVPEGLRTLPRPVDDYAAVVLARRYLAR